MADLLRGKLALSLDLREVASLFVLGGDFWDKVKALCIYEAKAQIPQRTAVPKYGSAR